MSRVIPVCTLGNRHFPRVPFLTFDWQSWTTLNDLAKLMSTTSKQTMNANAIFNSEKQVSNVKVSTSAPAFFDG